MRQLAEMLEPLVTAIVRDDERHAGAWASFGKAAEVARRLPLVHRTCKPGSEALWLDVLKTRRFAANEPCTGDREKAAGIPRAAYFFLGCGAYPDGLVGFVLDAATVLTRPASYTPFDSGSIQKYAEPMDPVVAKTWDATTKDKFLADHAGAGADLGAFAAPYLAGHFREPMTYVRLGQQSVPDYPVYHGLQDKSRDRRAWTVEVQVHEDVLFGGDGKTLLEIVVAHPDLLEDLPDDLKGLATVAKSEDKVLDTIAEIIEGRVAKGAP